MMACILGCAGAVLGEAERDFFREADPFGFIIFARNCQNRDQLSTLIEDLRLCVGRRAPVLIDQEGGRVQRLRPPQWRAAPPAGRFGALYRQAPDLAVRAIRLNAYRVAGDLHEVGIDVNCAPVLDLQERRGHQVIGDRAFSDDPATVAALGLACAEGLRAGGVMPVIKHLPGHGRAQVDSHHALPVIAASLDALLQRDLVPFQALADMPAGMTGHLVLNAVDPDQPATLSRQVIRQLIRGLVGFDGLLLSDDLAMQALTGPLGGRAAAAISAGCDIAMHCNGAMAEMMAVADRLPVLAGDALRRAESLLSAIETPPAPGATLRRDLADAALWRVIDDA